MPAHDPSVVSLGRQLDSLYAFGSSQKVDTGGFLSAVLATAEQLPNSTHAVNVCTDRLSFATGFFAALIRGQTTVLLPGHADGVQASASELFPNSYTLDESSIVNHGPPVERLNVFENRLSGLSIEHIAAVVFSSGTTGLHKQIFKTWGSLFGGALINAHCLRRHSQSSDPISMVATVPTWHMYGLEWSVLLPLVSEFAVCTRSAFFPADIQECLEMADERRVLLSTPMHLRALLNSRLKLPRLAMVISATSPLDAALARQIEQEWGAAVLEIYGCSEVGSMASRDAAADADWEFFPEFNISDRDGTATIQGDHCGAAVPLADQLDFSPDGSFRLVGRDEDMVKIAGKRGSLVDINQCLLAIDGVLDGVVYDPVNLELPETGRLAALVVVSGLLESDLRAALRDLVDSAFVPRPIHIVEAMPRSDAGKLRKADLRELVHSLRPAGTDA